VESASVASLVVIQLSAFWFFPDLSEDYGYNTIDIFFVGLLLQRQGNRLRLIREKLEKFSSRPQTVILDYMIWWLMA
jgi:hypothetical protein